MIKKSFLNHTYFHDFIGSVGSDFKDEREINRLEGKVSEITGFFTSVKYFLQNCNKFR